MMGEAAVMGYDFVLAREVEQDTCTASFARAAPAKPILNLSTRSQLYRGARAALQAVTMVAGVTTPCKRRLRSAKQGVLWYPASLALAAGNCAGTARCTALRTTLLQLQASASLGSSLYQACVSCRENLPYLG